MAGLMIDLGDELADWSAAKPETVFLAEFLVNTPITLWQPCNAGRLSDLQAQGFNTEPPPGFDQEGW